MAVLSRLFFYPIKSARGIEVTSARASALGLEGDRRFMFVDEHGLFVTQRDHPALARMVPSFDADHLVVSVDGLGQATVSRAPEGPPVDVEVWGDRVVAVHASGLVEELVTELVGARLRFVYFPPTERRQVDRAYAREGDLTAFSDGFPYLVAGSASVRDVSREVGHEIIVERFRPNLLIETGTPYDEEAWRRITVGAIPFRLPKPCARCTVTTVDPFTGARDKEPLATLARTRKRDGKVIFGMNAIADAEGTLTVGDQVVVTHRSS